ncbi:hypothetical protein RhiirA4_470738 [Rhizophagus irregularis]|uniref:Uncharacterized protein n=1 Tax=Rhizophagus irregularis TaxID=588596 RepID=A0A2I1H1S3_9GLOM|nr:hypothetical protein RhiirA4_470738 [Rhizophagus irregularis]
MTALWHFASGLVTSEASHLSLVVKIHNIVNLSTLTPHFVQSNLYTESEFSYYYEHKDKVGIFESQLSFRGFRSSCIFGYISEFLVTFQKFYYKFRNYTEYGGCAFNTKSQLRTKQKGVIIEGVHLWKVHL